MLRRTPIQQIFPIPIEFLDDYPEEKELPTVTIRMSKSGDRRSISDTIYRQGYGSFLTLQMLQASYVIEESTIEWDDGELVFPKGFTYDQFVDAWDNLPSNFQDWLMKRIYDLNPDWDPDQDPTEESNGQ